MKYEIYWVSADGNASLDGGIHDTDVDLDKEIEAFRAELLAQCAGDDDVEGINSGSFKVRKLEEE